MKRLTQIALALSFAGLTFSIPSLAAFTSSNPAPTTAPTKAQQKLSLLFVLRADTGVISKTDSGYELALQGVDDKVLYFSDRPVRKAGLLMLSNFINKWDKSNNSFQKNPPNAAITHAALTPNAQGTVQAVAVELSGLVKMENNTLTFKLKTLSGPLKVGSYHKINIFIDPAPVGDADALWNYDCQDTEGGCW